jgi:hypothetical protein
MVSVAAARACGKLIRAGRVEQHDRAVNGLKDPVGVLREVRVTGRVEQVEHVPVVVELQHRRGDGDAAVLRSGRPEPKSAGRHEDLATSAPAHPSIPGPHPAVGHRGVRRPRVRATLRYLLWSRTLRGAVGRLSSSLVRFLMAAGSISALSPRGQVVPQFTLAVA